MINIKKIRAGHRDHGCLISNNPIKHRGCALDFQGFLVAIDCDECDLFSIEGQKKPDLLVLRENNNKHEWFVIEIKKQLRRQAWDQVKSGLNILSENTDLFGDKQAYKPQALFAFTRGNKVADIQRRRPPLKFSGKTVPTMTRKCGGKRI